MRIEAQDVGQKELIKDFVYHTKGLRLYPRGQKLQTCEEQSQEHADLFCFPHLQTIKKMN